MYENKKTMESDLFSIISGTLYLGDIPIEEYYEEIRNCCDTFGFLEDFTKMVFFKDSHQIILKKTAMIGFGRPLDEIVKKLGTTISNA